MSNVTMKSTKAEIMDALKAAEAQLAQRASVIQSPFESDKKAQEDEIIQMAATSVKEGIFSSELNEQYDNLVSAIELLKARLQEQYDVEEALLNLVTVTNASKELQIRMQDEVNALSESISQLKVEYANARKEAEAEHEAEERDYQEELSKDRAREKADYEYNLKRERKAEKDAYDDEMAEANKTLDQVRQEAERIAVENEQNEDEILEMKAKIEMFPKELEEKFNEGYDAGERAAGKEYGYKKSMAEKEHEFELRDRDNRIARLENELDEKSRKVEALEDKLDAAYTQLRELATKTVESNGSIKVIGSGNDSTSKR